MFRFTKVSQKFHKMIVRVAYSLWFLFNVVFLVNYWEDACELEINLLLHLVAQLTCVVFAEILHISEPYFPFAPRDPGCGPIWHRILFMNSGLFYLLTLIALTFVGFTNKTWTGKNNPCESDALMIYTQVLLCLTYSVWITIGLFFYWLKNCRVI